MTEQTAAAKKSKSTKPDSEKTPPIGRLTISEVDAALADCEKTIKGHSEIVRSKLGTNASIPANVLRELSRANVLKSRLMLRRISVLLECGDAAVMDMIDKLMKVKPVKAPGQ